MDSLEIGRGLAALAVVFYHADSQLTASPFGEVHWLFRGGSTGVEYFFVLSGFLMMHLYRTKFGEKQDAKQFLIKRIERIYPLYWIIALPLLAISLAGFGGAVEQGQIFTSITLLPTPLQPRHGVAWSLVYEMYFYALFAIALARPRLGIALAGMVVAGAVTSILFGPFVWPLKFFIAPIVLLFGMGMFAALAVPYAARHARTWLAVGLAIFGTAAIGLAGQYIPQETATLLCGIGAAVTIAGMVAREARSKPYAKPIVALGGASYALYLIHYPVMSFLGKLIAASGLGLPNWAVMGIFLGASLVAGFAVHYGIERPVTRWLKNRSQGSSPAQAFTPPTFEKQSPHAARNAST